MNDPSSQRYFIAIVPPSPVFEEIVQIKEHFNSAFHSKAALNSPPHVTLHMPFLWKEKKEMILIEKLRHFTAAIERFEITLSGFGAFEPRVIFINTAESQELINLQTQLHRFCKTELNVFNAQYKNLPFHPHITIAFRDLKKDFFYSAWPLFRDKPFSASISVDKIVLLKKEDQRWSPIEDLLLH